MQSRDNINEAVQISVPSLVQLNRQSHSIPLHAGRITARQAGDYQSPFKGRGMEFDESRMYQPGDDTRNINWRITARTGKPYTKIFREERERPVFVWVDLRATMHFATRGKFKSVLASHFASLLAWSAVHNGDRVGGVIFSDSVHHELKPSRGKSGVLRLINNLAGHPGWQNNSKVEIDTSAGLRALVRLRRVARPGSMIFLISDFRHLDETAENQLIRLSQHNDVVMLYIHDQLESELPPKGKYRLSDGKRDSLLDTYDTDRVVRYHRRHLDFVSRLRQLSRKGNIRLISCTTEDDPLSVLRTGLTMRK